MKITRIHDIFDSFLLHGQEWRDYIVMLLLLLLLLLLFCISAALLLVLMCCIREPHAIFPLAFPPCEVLAFGYGSSFFNVSTVGHTTAAVIPHMCCILFWAEQPKPNNLKKQTVLI